MKLSPRPTSEELRELVVALNHVAGLSLSLVEGSAVIDGESVAATAISSGAAKESLLGPEIVVKLFVSERHQGARSTWALAFFYIDGRRIAPKGLSHVGFAFDEGHGWRKTGWEGDEYGEWDEMDGTDDRGDSRAP